MIVDANRTYLQDRHHQQAVASLRGRSDERVGVGIDIAGPDVRFADLARSFGVHAIGPVGDRPGLERALAAGIERVRAGEPVLLEVETTKG
jgi:hypothetical protein